MRFFGILLLLILFAIAYDYLNARIFWHRKELQIFNQTGDFCAKVSVSPSAMPTGTHLAQSVGKL